MYATRRRIPQDPIGHTMSFGVKDRLKGPDTGGEGGGAFVAIGLHLGDIPRQPDVLDAKCGFRLERVGVCGTYEIVDQTLY